MESRLWLIQSIVALTWLAEAASHVHSCGDDCPLQQEHYQCGDDCPLGKGHHSCGDKCHVEQKEETESSGSEEKRLPKCPGQPSYRGHFRVDLHQQSLDTINSKFSHVLSGGYRKPEGCVTDQRVAIVVPYRDRPDDLVLFLNNLHAFLAYQFVEYRIYLVEQADDKHFNRGSLLNIGVVESLKDHDYDCIILHDVDKFPENTGNVYQCGSKPRHLITKLKYKNQATYRPIPYADYFGGVTAISAKHFKQANGFSNRFWGWGSEDDDFHNRLKYHSIETVRVPQEIGKYAEIWHPYGFVNPERHKLTKEGESFFHTDGLSNVDYVVNGRRSEPLYTVLSVYLQHKDPYYSKPDPGEKQEL